MFCRIIATGVNIWGLICISVEAGVAPSFSTEIGRILGYPGGELVVEEVTDSEREIYFMPTQREKRRNLEPSLEAGRIVSAYRITGEVPSSFYPVLVLVTREGGLLSAETQELIDRFEGLPEAPVKEGGRGPFGRFAAEGSTDGGLYMGEVRVPSEIEEMDEPGGAPSVISELRFPDGKVDVRVAVISAFPDGATLVEVAGGEEYFRMFGGGDQSEERPDPDLQALFSAMNREVLRSVVPDIPGKIPSPLPGGGTLRIVDPEEAGAADKGGAAAGGPAEDGWAGLWWAVAGIGAVILAALVWRGRRS